MSEILIAWHLGLRNPSAHVAAPYSWKIETTIRLATIHPLPIKLKGLQWHVRFTETQAVIALTFMQ
jgi:hypothetical protein